MTNIFKNKYRHLLPGVSLKKACVFFCLTFFCLFTKAQNPVETRGIIVASDKPTDSLQGDVYAIITGISNYRGINPLKYADKDALLFRDFLRTPSGGNTKPENILSLINDSAKAADFNVKAYSWLLRKKLKKGDRLYLYFSGHGDAMSEDLYFFLPYDCEPNKDDHNYLGTGNINMHSVKTLFIKPQVQKGVEVLLIMDACRTNELPGGQTGQQNFTNNFIAEQKMGDIILLSTGAGQVAIESPAIGNGHGLFTYYLVDGLAGAADKDSLDGDNNGQVSLAEISSYVKNQVRRKARTDFNTVQIPYYCCGEKDQATIAKIDPATYAAWQNSKKLQELSGDQNLFTVNTSSQAQKGVGNLTQRDTLQIEIYNRFSGALKREKLIGEESAETYYNQLEKNWPGSNLTEDARFSLAAKYLNFCQQKLNLFLSGKGLVHILLMEKEISKDKKEKANEQGDITDLDEQIKKLKTLVTTGFDVAAVMMEKALGLLKTEPAMQEPFLPKADFLNTMAAYSNKKIKLKDVIPYCRKAIESDPASASGYLLMGWIYQDMQDDSSAFYFRKAAAIAPKWAYPMNGLGNYYFLKNNKKEALVYFFNAIKLDKLYSSAYRSIGMTYYNQKVFDSAKYYFKKAVDIDPCDSYANENYGSANADYISREFGSISTDNTYFNIARKFFFKSIECDKGFAPAYLKMALLYSRANNPDSALAMLQQFVTLNQTNAEGYRNLGTYYLNNIKDTAKAEENFKKAVMLDPTNGDNYYYLARLYRKQKNKQKAIAVYNAALDNIGSNKDLYNELGNVYFELPSQFDSAIFYYNKALELDSSQAYVYFNLGKLYGLKNKLPDSSVFYYAKAVLHDPDRFQKMSHTIADFYYDGKNMNEAKNYYRHALEKVTPTRTWDAERLVSIQLSEGNFTGAAHDLKQLLNPVSDNFLYTKLSAAVSKAALQ